MRLRRIAKRKSAVHEVLQMGSPMKRLGHALSRRQWLLVAAQTLSSLFIRQSVRGQVTGRADPKLAAYDELMHQFMRKHRPPGASLAVTYHGRLVYARGFGHANLEQQEPVKPGSLFRIASI